MRCFAAVAAAGLLVQESTPPTGPLTRDTKLPWDGIEDAIDVLGAPHGKALLQKRKLSTPPTGLLTSHTKLPWDGIQDTLDVLGAPTGARALLQERTRTRRVGSIGGGASDLHFLAAASLPADAGDHEDAVTVAAVGGEGGEDEDAGQKASVEDAASTAAADAAGENADNDNLESILLQKGTTTRLLQKTSTPPTGPLTRDTKLPWDGIQDTLDELDAFPAPHGKALLQKQKTSTPPTGPLTRDTKLPWDGIQDTLDELDAFPAPHGKALLQRQKMYLAQGWGKALLQGKSLRSVSRLVSRRDVATCEECLAGGEDYCISSGECVERGTKACANPEDHVTGSSEFAEEWKASGFPGEVKQSCPDWLFDKQPLLYNAQAMHAAVVGTQDGATAFDEGRRLL
jgi:hypothetical protein